MLDADSFDRTPTPDQLEALGDEIATFAARIDVAEHALLTRLRLFDLHEAWAQTGFVSCAHWLSWRIGIGLEAAREKVRVARALGELEKVDVLFGRGELSYSKVRAITRVATAKTEQDFVDLALHATAAQVERLVRAYRRSADASAAQDGPVRDQRRYVRRSETAGGMVRIEMQLPPEEAALVWEALMAAGEQSEASAEASAADHAVDDPSAETSEASEASSIAAVASYPTSRPQPRAGRSSRSSSCSCARPIFSSTPARRRRVGTAGMDLGETLDWMLIAEQTRSARERTCAPGR
jgi:hypothetical protein